MEFDPYSGLQVSTAERTLMSPWLSAAVLEISPGNERVATVPLQVAERRALTKLLFGA